MALASRRWVLAVVAAAGAAFACNAIVGVEDVTEKKGGIGTSSSSSSASSSSSSSGGPLTPVPGDDDDDVVDAGTDANKVLPECNGVVDCERLVFVTRAKFTGNLGGIAGADQKCFEEGKKVPGYAGRAFRAWISDGTSSIANRLPKGTKPYRRTDGSILATSFVDLTDGTLNLGPNLDQEAKPIEGGLTERAVWTATNKAGAGVTDNCNDWRSAASADLGAFGDSQKTNEEWTDYGSVISCSTEYHLYCIEY